MTKSGDSEALKPRTLKSGGGGLEPSSLIEVCAYVCIPPAPSMSQYPHPVAVQDFEKDRAD